MLFLQISGCMGTGKTTAARTFIREKGGFRVEFMNVFGKEYPYTFNPTENIVVCGRYDRNICGGIDGTIHDSNVVKQYVMQILRLKPKLIVFEGVMYGLTYKFSSELAMICRLNGYEYKAIVLAPDFNVLLERIYERNGGKPIKVDSLNKNYMSSIRSSQKLKDSGVFVKFIDTAKIPKEDMWRLIEDET